MIKTEKITVKTKGNDDILDVTDRVQQIISHSKTKQGIATIFVTGSTASVTTIEFEPGLQKDFPEALEKIAPRNKDYKHHQTWHDDNGSSHVKASLIGPSLTIPFENSKLTLGTWQQIVLIDHDTRPRDREMIIQIIGD